METVLFTLLLGSPLAGFLINLCIGKKLPGMLSGCIANTMMLLSFISALVLFVNNQFIEVNLFTWLSLQNFNIDLSFAVDRLSMLWIMFVTGIGFLIHLYSMGYMKTDPQKSLFFCYLNLFIFFMLILVLASNLGVMFIGWEGVGLCSYLLIGFWNKDHANNNAAKKAFIMNRIGDLGFLIGIILLAYQYGTLEFTSLHNILALGTSDTGLLNVAALALFIGAVGKSAQVPLYTWLPDAMAGPTPVSALIHAATMVTAGIYMIVKLNFLYMLTPDILLVVTIIGSITALLAASIGLMQNDIKKVLAYSTISQLGLMFMALGVGAYHIAVFHVITHAFFKACLFLGAGSVIHAMGGEQDIRKMGGIKSKLKVTHITFLLATCSIAGIPLFAGFFSKDEIMISLFHSNILVWVIGAITSLMTAYYMFRVYFLTFCGKFRGTDEQEKHLHESPTSMTLPLIVLAFFSVVAGYIGLPIGYNWLNEYLTPYLPNIAYMHHDFNGTSILLMAISILIAIAGFFLAYKKYILDKKLPIGDDYYQGLSKIIYHKYYIDELYDRVFVRPISLLGEICKEVVDRLIKLIVNLGGNLALWSSSPLARLQNGSVSLYLFFFVVGFVVIAAALFFII